MAYLLLLVAAVLSIMGLGACWIENSAPVLDEPELDAGEEDAGDSDGL